MVTRTHLNVTFIPTLPVFFLSYQFFVSRRFCLYPYFSFRSRDNIHCLGMGCRSVVQYPAWGKRCFLFHNLQTGSAAHSTFFIIIFFSMDACYSFRGWINRLAPESEHSPLSSAESKNQWACISDPLARLYDVQSNNFVCTFIFSLLVKYLRSESSIRQARHLLSADESKSMWQLSILGL